jgi:hypothetical protein
MDYWATYVPTHVFLKLSLHSQHFVTIMESMSLVHSL